MSLLSAVLQVVDETNRNEFKLQFKDVSRRTATFVDSVKHFTTDVKDVLASQFIDYLPVKSLEYVNFNDRRNKLQRELDELQSMIDKILENNSISNSRFKALYEEFVITSNKFKYMSDLGQCAKDLEISERLIERRQYKKASEKLEKLLEILEYPVNYKELTVLIDSMKDIISFNHVKCLYKITEQWRERLKWSESETNKGHLIVVEINISDPENLQEILNALSSSKRINVEMMKFADFIIKTVVPALLTKDCTVNVRENLHKIFLEIEYTDVRKSKDVKTILKNLITFFETIQTNIDCRWEDNRTVFSILGHILSKDFFKMLKENCLQDLVTTDESKVESYLSIAAEIEKFSEYLCEINFIDKDSSPLLEFTKDTHSLICERRCKVILGRARNLMKTNLQEDIIEVSLNQTPEICIDEMKMLEKEIYIDRNITECPFLLPRCSISLSAKKILQLVIEQLDLAHSSSPTMSNKILITVRNIFELYYALVPEYHEDMLANNPLDLALFYNNCFYLAHGMLGHPWCKVFQKDFADNINILLADQVQNIRRVATVKLATYIKEQKHIIKDTIEKSELNDLMKANPWDIDNISAVITCMELLEKLQRQWQPVLPIVVYEKTMANLVGCFAEELVQVVMTINETVLKEEVAMAIIDLYKPILDRVPKLFDEAMDEEKLSRKWLRLVELTSLLSCPMFSIACRWKQPDSRLPTLFTCDEIIHFIRIRFPANKNKITALEMIQRA